MFPQLAMIKYNTFNEKAKSYDFKNKKIKQLVAQLQDLKYEPKTIVSILPSESWFYDSQKNKITTSFIISGLSQFPSLIQIEKEMLNSNHYSYSSYKDLYIPLNTLSDLNNQAKKLGYEKILLFYTNPQDELQKKWIKVE